MLPRAARWGQPALPPKAPVGLAVLSPPRPKDKNAAYYRDAPGEERNLVSRSWIRYLYAGVHR